MPIACDSGKREAFFTSTGHKSSIRLLLLIDFESTFAKAEKKTPLIYDSI